MRRYEVVIVLIPTLSEEEVEQTTDSFKQAAEESGATISGLDLWGKRKLAYPIKKHGEGIYVLLTLEEQAAQAVSELERRFRVNDTVIRFLTTRMDLDIKRAEKSRARREKGRKEATPPPAASEPAVAAED